MLAHGLVQWDCLSDAPRCPLFAETLDRANAYYAGEFGPDSDQVNKARILPNRYPSGMVEPRVIESIFDAMVAAEANITLCRRHEVVRAERRYNRVHGVLLRDRQTGNHVAVEADHFIDASYEADLAAAAGCRYRVGRESHEQHGEPHAGRLYTQMASGPAPEPELARSRGLVPFGAQMGGVDPQSPRTGDRCIQGYNMRLVLTNVPGRGIALKSPPARYRR